PLFGKTPEETGLIWRAIAECESYMISAGDKVVRPIFFAKGLDKVEEIQQAAQTLRHELKMIDARLAGSEWLVSDKISPANIVIFPLFHLLWRAASKEPAHPFKLGFPPLAKIFPTPPSGVQRIEALPTYQRTYPPHWRQ